ncbi:M48 family metallopeptidase [Mucilaginibacter sp.]
MDLIKIGDINVEVSFKDIKNVHLSVHPPLGRVTLSAPQQISLDKLKIYTATKLPWIKTERAKILNQEREQEKEYITRESHFLLGKRYLLQVTEARSNKVLIHHSKIELLTPSPCSKSNRREMLYNFYRRELRKLLIKLINQFAHAMGLSVPKFGIRVMKTKWGSCAATNRNLWFNIELAKKPLGCIEYIVVHELVHLIERHHNKNFILLMNRYLPNWQIQKRLLNKLPI